jgi:hypothetical protein
MRNIRWLAGALPPASNAQTGHHERSTAHGWIQHGACGHPSLRDAARPYSPPGKQTMARHWRPPSPPSAPHCRAATPATAVPRQPRQGSKQQQVLALLPRPKARPSPRSPRPPAGPTTPFAASSLPSRSAKASWSPCWSGSGRSARTGTAPRAATASTAPPRPAGAAGTHQRPALCGGALPGLHRRAGAGVSGQLAGSQECRHPRVRTCGALR